MITAAQTLTAQGFFPQVSPEQLHGMELNEYAHELAQTTVWIGYIQWMRDNGYGRPTEPILKDVEMIRQMDAILTFDEAGNPVEPEWVPADVVIGNPPFLGGKKMRSELGDHYVEQLRQLYEERVPPNADFVTYWFERVRLYIENGIVKRAGLLATNSIRGGASRTILERIKATGDIFMAWSDRPWVLEGAAVRVSILGFDNGDEDKKFLDGQAVLQIMPDLTPTLDITTAKVLQENTRISFIGTQKSGPFDITKEQAEKMLKSFGNPNGRPNSDVVKSSINAFDVTRRSRDMYIIDFGTDLSVDEAAEYEMPFEYVKEHVLPIRELVRRDSHRRYWWRFGDTRPGLRRAVKDLRRIIVTPAVSKYRLFVWMLNDVVVDHACIVFARDDDYFFGVLHSRIHELWALRMGTSLEDRPRYTPTTTFETFPFPFPPGQEPPDDPRVQAIAEAARSLVEKRNRWLNPDGADVEELKKRTLTNLYNQRPQWLANAHAALDAAVFAAYGWDATMGDEAVLAALLALNEERS